ncbi:MAG TPA: carboxylating nicotinate-nucleotide diphosphorylase [Gemmatimonadales bacterium]|nr:carboxylating nicotinate-nucleotide diphosphorylase [Gemmatimonadales bacterium]
MDRLPAESLESVRGALREDRASEDVTTRLLGGAAEQSAMARLVAEDEFVVAGLPLAAAVFRELDPGAQLSESAEGEWARPGDIIAAIRGRAGAILSAERVALNFVQRLSGIATATRRAVAAVAGTSAQITHTRKTTPGLRALEQYAIRVGGGVDNRASLADAVLWKDNHWALLAQSGRSFADALRDAASNTPVIVEVENDAQLEEALAAGVTHLLVDNQSPEQVAAWVRRAGPGIIIQASGGITLENARAYAEAGANLIAIGALTHSASAVPITCEIVND